MELDKFLASLLLFVFTVFLFPDLYSSAQAYTGELVTLIHAFPIIFIAVTATIPIYYGLKEGKD
jgi:hypothetical protein